jgi:hypothetical protein
MGSIEIINRPRVPIGGCSRRPSGSFLWQNVSLTSDDCSCWLSLLLVGGATAHNVRPARHSPLPPMKWSCRRRGANALGPRPTRRARPVSSRLARPGNNTDRSRPPPHGNHCHELPTAWRASMSLFVDKPFHSHSTCATGSTLSSEILLDPDEKQLLVPSVGCTSKTYQERVLPKARSSSHSCCMQAGRQAGRLCTNRFTRFAQPSPVYIPPPVNPCRPPSGLVNSFGSTARSECPQPSRQRRPLVEPTSQRRITRPSDPRSSVCPGYGLARTIGNPW